MLLPCCGFLVRVPDGLEKLPLEVERAFFDP